MAFLAETIAVTRMNVKSLPQRAWLAAVTILAVAVVVAVMCAFLAMADGFQKTVQGAGSPNMAMMMREGSQAEINSSLDGDQVKLLMQSPGIMRNDKDQPLASAELFVIVDGTKKSTGLSVNLPMRGMDSMGLELRPTVNILEGRMFTPGTNEIVIGRAARDEFVGFEVGKDIEFGKSVWKVVGIFEAGGSVFESEIWADARTVQSIFNRGNSFQSVRARLDGAGGLGLIKNYIKGDKRLNVDVQTEAAYFATQSEGIAKVIRYVGYPLSVVMALGALAGALNAMYSSVAVRLREIVTLRAIGFGGFSTFVGTLIEALVLAFLGWVLGLICAYVLFDGVTASTLGSTFSQVVFDFDVTPALMIQSAWLALIVGLIGGFFPALRAAQLPVVNAFRAV